MSVIVQPLLPAPRVLVSQQGAVLLLRAGRVVGGRQLAGSGAISPLTMRVGARYPLLTSEVAMRGCPLQTAGEDGGPPLPAGEYQLVVEVGYQTDALYQSADLAPASASPPEITGTLPPRLAPGRRFQLVSDPVTVQIG